MTMKKSKFSKAQIAFILRQGDEGMAVGEVCRKAGISEATYCNSEMKRLRPLEEENGKLKKTRRHRQKSEACSQWLLV